MLIIYTYRGLHTLTLNLSLLVTVFFSLPRNPNFLPSSARSRAFLYVSVVARNRKIARRAVKGQRISSGVPSPEPERDIERHTESYFEIVCFWFVCVCVFGENVQRNRVDDAAGVRHQWIHTDEQVFREGAAGESGGAGIRERAGGGRSIAEGE